jgi:hypothetical protein
MSDTPYLRLVRRLTSLELDSGEAFAEAEFRKRDGTYDKELSVFEVQDEHVVRARTEFCASHEKKPPTARKASVWVVPPSTVSVKPEPGDTRFSFTQKLHRSLVLLTDAEVLTIGQAVFSTLVDRLRSTEVESMRGYVTGRLGARDKEWLDLMAAEDRSHWRQKWGPAPSKQLDFAGATPPQTAAEPGSDD